MNLESLTMEVRPRSPWESMDLAVRLAVRHWRLLFSSWMVTVFPLFLIINIILLEEHPYWAYGLVWFLKPLYDRVPLFVLSRAVFAENVTWKDTLNAVPGFFKTGVFSSLTWYRLDPGRAFALPVRQLEGLSGKRRRQRMNTLGRGVNNREVLLFILCFHLESLITWGVLGMVLMLLPSHMAMQGAETLFMNTEPDLLTSAVSMVLYFLVMMIVETLYVAGGFILYLNRRIILEGWDIELTFRKLQQRLDQSKSHNSNEKSAITAVAVICLWVSLFSGVYPVEVQAAGNNLSSAYEKILPPVATPSLPAEASGDIISEVMAEPLFSQVKKTETLKYTGPEKDQKDKKNLDKTRTMLTDVFEFIGNTIAFVFEVGLWLLLLVAVVLLVKYRHRLNLGFGHKERSPGTEIPEMLFGLDLREESLPDDVATAAMQFFQAHDYRAALAILYRATLAYLVKHYEFTLAKGATEGDCLELVTSKLPLPTQSHIDYFIDLTRAWQLTAYGHKDIPSGQMKQLCLDWSGYYGEDKIEVPTREAKK